jgi:hypothetical protein
VGGFLCHGLSCIRAVLGSEQVTGTVLLFSGLSTQEIDPFPFLPKTGAVAGYLWPLELVEKSIAFVASKATLEDAKAEMEKTSNCQDVFVTQTGKADEPIQGWLTNTEISKHLK